MKVNGFACDQCDRFSETNDSFITINRQDLIAEVCGTPCLVKMARELLAAETKVTKASAVGRALQANGMIEEDQPRVPSDDQLNKARARLNGNGKGMVVCSECGKEIRTSYIGHHLRTQHGIRGGISGQPRNTQRRFNGQVEDVVLPRLPDVPSAS